MAVFDWVESPGTQLSEEPRINETPFGDGYKERAPDGLNPVTQKWQLQFSQVDLAAADAIVAFLRARTSALGLEAFDWTPLWHTTPIKVLCRGFTRTADADPTTNTVTAVFEQVHEP